MRPRATLAVVLAAAIGLGAAAPIAAAGSGHQLSASRLEPAAQRGEAFARRRCGGCHNVSADDGPPYEGPAFRRLVDRYDPAQLSIRFAQVSAHGVDRMPPITFSQDERADLLAYVRTLRPE
ncbi:MAG TPA: cytochrome c [Phenylobacterium sp.]|uniref:c-type cytochrome n=1 Tax=Phenylobacterium sp. TaxID=1871053 RepID=UPI002B465A28|nr:cytochrome c [Phenylobacterium sp.]HKR89964.1 cytochrome c [Phenylobacterium sp.]